MKTTKKAKKKSIPAGAIDIKMLPELLGLVEYSYSNFVRVSHSSSDVRIAFGDISPTGELKPRVGVVLSQRVALNFGEALQRLLESMKATAESPDDDVVAL